MFLITICDFSNRYNRNRVWVSHLKRKLIEIKGLPRLALSRTLIKWIGTVDKRIRDGAVSFQWLSIYSLSIICHVNSARRYLFITRSNSTEYERNNITTWYKEGARAVNINEKLTNTIGWANYYQFVILNNIELRCSLLVKPPTTSTFASTDDFGYDTHNSCYLTLLNLY